ncbi:unnamed protein product [Sphagnum balticum]|jgi:hypothetical protein
MAPGDSPESTVQGIPDTPTIRVIVVQTGRRSKFNIVERSTWKDAIWSEHDSTRHNLTLGGTDASGILRFKSEGFTPEFFLVALGMKKSLLERWCDLKVDAKRDFTAASMHQNYHENNTPESETKHEKKWEMRATSAMGTVVTVEYHDDQTPDNLRVVIITIR